MWILHCRIYSVCVGFIWCVPYVLTEYCCFFSVIRFRCFSRYRIQSSESITWITPFVAGILDDVIWDSFTLILPVNDSSKYVYEWNPFDTRFVWIGAERISYSRSKIKSKRTVRYFLQCDCITSLQWVAHLIESHASGEQGAGRNVSHHELVGGLFVGHHEIDLFLCVIREGCVGWCE